MSLKVLRHLNPMTVNDCNVECVKYMNTDMLI